MQELNENRFESGERSSVRDITYAGNNCLPILIEIGEFSHANIRHPANQHEDGVSDL